MKADTNRARNMVVNLLRAEGFHMLEYKSYSSSSVYIKPDGGLHGTIRIADHEGKSHLEYGFNVHTNLPEDTIKFTPTSRGGERVYVSVDMIPAMVDGLVEKRRQWLEVTTSEKYQESVDHNLSNRGRHKGFWSKCKEVR